MDRLTNTSVLKLQLALTNEHGHKHMKDNRLTYALAAPTVRRALAANLKETIWIEVF